MGNFCTNTDTINNQNRGVVEIIYSSTTGNSKNAALQLQTLLEQHHYIVPVTNIGDYPHEDLPDQKTTLLLLLSTYGNGDSPDDGEQFLDWIQKLSPSKQFTEIQYAILAFGNSNFDRHCGFGYRTEKVLKECGAQQILELTKCDAASKDRDFDMQYPTWSKNLVEKLNLTHPLLPASQMSKQGSHFATIQDRPDFDWQANINKVGNLSRQFSTYWQMPLCKVVHIKELRKDASDGRSTLWVRIETPQDMKLTPGCNISLFPINSLEQDPEDSKIVEFSQVRGKVPFPPMPLRQIRKLIDYRIPITDKQSKLGLIKSTCEPDIRQKLISKLKEEKELKMTVKEFMEQAKPELAFMATLGLNNIRSYTLTSWDPDQKYLDLVVSLVPNGLTSNFLKTLPQKLRIKPVPSSFYIPQGKPICMIANGSGIAPMRSIVQYISQLPQAQRNPLRLYYGIQNQESDFYFGQQWRSWQKEKLCELRLAQSRKDPNKKVYVQHLLAQDVKWLQEHLFRNQGVIFLCGGQGMSRQFDQVLHNAIVAEVKIPYKAFTKKTELKQNKIIVQEVYG